MLNKKQRPLSKGTSVYNNQASSQVTAAMTPMASAPVVPAI
jgi:hypothetical protein